MLAWGLVNKLRNRMVCTLGTEQQSRTVIAWTLHTQILQQGPRIFVVNVRRFLPNGCWRSSIKEWSGSCPLNKNLSNPYFSKTLFAQWLLGFSSIVSNSVVASPAQAPAPKPNAIYLRDKASEPKSLLCIAHEILERGSRKCCKNVPASQLFAAFGDPGWPPLAQWPARLLLNHPKGMSYKLM